MTIRHTDQHDANVCQALGVIADGNSALAGIEIETGWQSEARRTAFFKELEKRGIPANQCMSKHDGTIGNRGSTFPAEIVSVPLPFSELRKFTERVGQAIETMADKGLITSGAGVHIHVSEGLLPPDALWRYAAAICQDKSFVMRHAVTELKNKGTVDAYARMTSDVVQSFWDDVCLRRQGPYNRRVPYGKVAEIPKTTDHQRAFIHGRATPTYETRVFRTSKSHRVLASYVDTVESLLRFSLDPGPDVLETQNPPMTQEEYEELKRVAPPMLTYFSPDGTKVVYVDYEWGDQYTTQEVRPVDNHIEPKEEYLKRMGRRSLSEEERRLLQLMENDKGARGWISGTVPLQPYLKFITDNEKEYPFLAARLGYDKFSPYFGKGPIKPDYPHREEKHLEFQPGCIVRTEGGRGELYCLESIVNGDGPIKSVKFSVLETGVRVNQSFPVNILIHACKGALSPCGEI